MGGNQLTGIERADPLPGLIREIRFQQGPASRAGKARYVVLLGNKTASGTEPENALGMPVLGEEDMIERAGLRSELLLMYRAYLAVDPGATVYFIAVPEGPNATAASVTLTVTAAGSGATGITVAQIGLLGEQIEVTIVTGDSPAVIAANLAVAINAKLGWPATASVGASPNENLVTVACTNKGPRGDYVVATLRAKTGKNVGITIAKGSITSGQVDDDFTSAYAALTSADIYYQVSAKTTKGDGSPGNPAISATDNGIGEHAELVKRQSMAEFGKGSIAFFGLGGTSAQAITVGFAVNNVRCVFVHAKNPEWTPAMIAAHVAAVKRSREVAHPGANLTGYGLDGNEVFQIPDPFNKSDRLSKTELRIALNNGVTPIGHTTTGKAYIARQITSACTSGGSYDYRAREGHIPSCIDYFWEMVEAAYRAQMQPFLANDPPKGKKPLPSVQYPSALRALMNRELDRAIEFPGGPYLDPSCLEAMKASTVVERLADGLSARCNPVAVVHNNKGQFLLLESSEAY